MFGFPVNLQDSGVQKFTNDADSGFPKIQQREVFYSVKDGDWDNIMIWQTASGRVGKLPTSIDDVYIRNFITTIGLGTRNCKNLFISKSATLTTDANVNTLNVYGDIKSYGIINFNTFSVGHDLYLYGENNYIENISFNASSSIRYSRFGDQRILEDLPYTNVWFINGGTKYITKNFTINGNLYTRDSTNLELGFYDLNVSGSVNLSGFLKKSHFGNVVVGSFSPGSVGTPMFDFSSGNPNVEVKGGITFSRSVFYTGTGQWKFSTNNQSINDGSGAWSYPTGWDASVLIDNNINLTIGPNMQHLGISNVFNGSNSLSKLINQGTLFFNSLASVSSMTTGIWDFTTNANTIGYTGNYTATIPSYFNTFHNLTISGTGTKSLGVNTTLNGNLSIANGIIDFSTYNITINGTSTITANPGKIMKSGSGNVTFIGLLTIGTSGNNGGTLDFTSGNPNVEFRNGLTGDYSNQVTFKSGTGTWRFTTNNQKLGRSAGGGIWYYDCPILIENITLSVLTDNASLTATSVIRNSINGTTPTSNLINYSQLFFETTTAPMTIGTYDFTTNLNTIGYGMTTSFIIPYGSYRNLYCYSTSAKTLSQNTIVNGTLTSVGGSLDLSIYDIDIYGNTLLESSTLFKTGIGNVIFRGLLNFKDNHLLLNFSGGNPNVELRGGITFNYGTTWSTGTGIWSFTTNNQLFQINGIFNNFQFDCSIIISNVILTMNSNNRTYIFMKSINGTTSTSQLTIAATSTIQYQSATQPMATGILDTSTNLNTWVYGLNNQDIKGSPTISPKQVYRNLTLNGTGVKTLQGYCSVLNTYTLTAPATLANNGFTLTNP